MIAIEVDPACARILKNANGCCDVCGSSFACNVKQGDKTVPGTLQYGCTILLKLAVVDDDIWQPIGDGVATGRVSGDKRNCTRSWMTVEVGGDVMRV
ncbi:hypothetical protein KCU92_g300, partial [Aureobasidium melanogenum]